MSKVSLGDLSKACFTPKPVAFQAVLRNKDVLYCRKVGLAKPRGRRPTEVRFQKSGPGRRMWDLDLSSIVQSGKITACGRT